MNEKFEVLVDELPTCQGPHGSQPPLAHYDAQASGTTRWGYWCESCFRFYAGGRLGIGLGQRLVLKPTEADRQAWENEHRAEAEEGWTDEELVHVQSATQKKELRDALRKALAVQRAYNKICPSGNAMLDERVRVLQITLNKLTNF